MFEWSLFNKKLRFLLIHNSWKTEIWFFFSITEPYKDNLKPQFLIKSSYYIVASPYTALMWCVVGEGISDVSDAQKSFIFRPQKQLR